MKARKRTARPDRAFTRFYIPAMTPDWVRKMKDRAKAGDLQDARGSTLRLKAALKSSVVRQVTSDINSDDEMYSNGREV